MENNATHNKKVVKILLLMKLTIILSLFCGLSAFATSYGQNAKVSLRKGSVSLAEIFQQIQHQTEFRFVYGENVNENALYTIEADIKQKPVKDVLRQLNLSYEFRKNYLIVVKQQREDQQIRLIRGIVKDQDGEPVPGVTVRLNGEKESTVTAASGFYLIEAKKQSRYITFSSIGYITLRIDLAELDSTGRTIEVDAVLEKNEQALNEVIVTGVFNKSKETFTGAANTFSGEELKMIGNQNILQSLKSLDPSFVIIDNNMQGSNPNSLPDIEMRGKTSIAAVTDEFSSNPNLPLFVLDGFETSLQVINDLDINRVASITLLKDAASTALYGARAANGVIVIETVSPTPGEIRLSYTNDSKIEAADLSSYNMMNASEKLEFERLAGRYRTINGPLVQMQLDQLYNERLKAVQEGVDTYWLKIPVQTGFTHGHTLRANGGSEALQFDAGLSYKTNPGTMDGSKRDTWSGSTDIRYRRKKLNIVNQLFVSGYTGKDSPYGSFSDYVNANPYYKTHRDDGSIAPNLDNTIGTNNVVTNRIIVPNPLYNAVLMNIAQEKNFQVRDNLRFIYDLNNQLRFEGALQVSSSRTENIDFKDPLHTDFVNAPVNQRGTYSNTELHTRSVNSNFMVTYANNWNKHQLTSNLRGDIQDINSSILGFTAEGFPEGSNGNPVFAAGYTQNASPNSSNSHIRRANLLLGANYNYDIRYLVDLTYRIDGSTAFGSARKYSPFWSVGLGWNLHREQFVSEWRFIDFWKLRGNIGYTGNQNLGSTTSVSVYTYGASSNIFGQFLDLTSLGNPDLDWQRTIQTSLGMDITLFNSRFNATINYYEKDTDPMIVAVNIPSSVGIPSFENNLGKLTVKGWEADLNFFPIRDLSNRIMWNIGVFGSIVEGRYSDFGNALSLLNETQRTNNSLIRYHDGYSPDDIWAVVSRGIDPATGREIFLKQNGDETFVYDARDIVHVGNSRPVVEGVFRTNVTFKGFSLGLNFRYRLGGDLFNSALYNRVENISLLGLSNNQDKRALYDRWQEVGDISQFKSISITSTTPMSSRFVQKDNQLIGESIRLGWQSQREPWLKALRLQQLRFNAYMNDIFRLSTVQDERGISYPFARSVSFSINASF